MTVRVQDPRITSMEVLHGEYDRPSYLDCQRDGLRRLRAQLVAAGCGGRAGHKFLECLAMELALNVPLGGSCVLAVATKAQCH